jgi:hypothetical protein
LNPNSSISSSVKTLGWYETPNEGRKAAIVQSDFGRGRAVLCGPHLEYDPQFIAAHLDYKASSYEINAENRTYLGKIVPKLLEADSARSTVMASILSRLGLRLNPILSDSVFTNVNSPVYIFNLNYEKPGVYDSLKLDPIEEEIKDTLNTWKLMDITTQCPSSEGQKLNFCILSPGQEPSIIKSIENSVHFNLFEFSLVWQQKFKELSSSSLNDYLKFKNRFGGTFMYADNIPSTQTILEKYDFFTCVKRRKLTYLVL